MPTKPIPAIRVPEYVVHKAICQYIILQYPDAIFTSDGAGIRLSIGSAKKIKHLKSESGIPDVIVFESHHGYFGLLMEIKRDNVKLKKKDGSWADDHIREQAELHERLRKKGYFCDFVKGIDLGIKIADWYLGSGKFPV